MENDSLYTLKYPIGIFIAPEAYTSSYLENKINSLAEFPDLLEKETALLTAEQLDTPYRPDGWTIRQVVHHCAESHMNCFIRLKWTLTENTPVIKAYNEANWAALEDDCTLPIAPSIQLLKGLHQRIVYLMKNFTEKDLERAFIHPEDNNQYAIKEIIGKYAWHSAHHLAHITELKKRKKWK
ncbi:YfiT family bacillithiol transferase [Flavobacterium agrisoli]|uniref:Metal-dependent hydrolase n=1 Tax=Flavobacterium agrisoli TaxID=2793066 RepID=A0A934PLV6_9FLAO|nr:putative metal-dependent hydrolase [Flavobacterium agrisoli]MBK0369338.1 putative metal-dependent hydrolase [Flavobacterium agrisoli]